MKAKLLNVRKHLDFVQLMIEAYQKYGQCPLVDEGMAKLSLYNKAIIRKHEEKKSKGNRKDIAV